VGVLQDFDDDFLQIETTVKERPTQVSSEQWEELWRADGVPPERLFRLGRRRRRKPERPMVATFPGLVPVTDDTDSEPDHEIDTATFVDQLAAVRHRDQVGSLLLRYAGNFLSRVCLFAVHRGVAIGWMARGPGVVIDDVQSFSLPLDRPSLLRDLQREGDHHLGPIPKIGDNPLLEAALGDPPTRAAVLLAIRVKEHTVGYLLGDIPGESTLAVPVDELTDAVRKAGAALEILILRRKIVS
jgi:hypothetical protein